MKREHIVELIRRLISEGKDADGIVDELILKSLLNVSYGSQDVDLIAGVFKDTFRTTQTTRWDRYSAKRLSAKYGNEMVVMVIRGLAAHSGEQYAPVVNSVSDVEKKWNSILAFLQRNIGVGDTFNV